MSENNHKSQKQKELRQRAEKLFREKQVNIQNLPVEDVQRLVEELSVHQIELEMQNESLHKAQMDLEESKNRYYDLFDFAPIGYLTTDERGLIKEINLSGAELLGAERRRLIGKYFDLFVIKDDRALFSAHRQKIFETRGQQICELRLVKSDGTVVFSQLQSAVRQNEQGDFTQLRIAVTDVTERKKAENALKESEAKYRQLIETAQEGIWAIDAGCITTFVNPRMAEILGYTPSEMLGKSLFWFMEKKKAGTVHRYLEDCRRGTRGERDLEFIRKDGARVYTSLRVSPLSDDQGNSLGVLALVADITDRKKAEEELKRHRDHLEQLVTERTSELATTNKRLRQKIADHRLSEILLRESEAKYLTLVNQARDGVVVIQDGLYRFVNQAMANMSGYTIEELVDKPILDLAAAEYREQTAQWYFMQLAGDMVTPFHETKILCGDGAAKDAEVSSAIIEYGGRQALMAIIRDVTKHKKIEEELQKAQRLESIGLLAGGIAHDFRNILMAIVGNISLAKLYLHPEDKIYAFMDQAEKASMRAKGLTQQLLTFSSGGAPIKNTTSLSALIREVSDFNIRGSVRGSAVKCELSLPDDLWSAEIDEGQIGQVLSNLIINAVQAMPQGGTIKVTAANVPAGEKEDLCLGEEYYIKASVEDQGTGIAKENFSRIFDPYFTTKKGGSGLGLTTAYSIIKRHGGYITLDSEEGIGSTFTFYLPASMQEVQAVAPQEEIIPHSDGGKILFMEDEEIVRDTAGKVLAFLGYVVEFVIDGDEAIEQYKKAQKSDQPFTAVILDLIIPGGMGGKEVIQKLHEMDPKVKAIVSSGYSNDPIMAGYKEYGFSGAIAKPYNVRELAEVLSKVNHES